MKVARDCPPIAYKVGIAGLLLVYYVTMTVTNKTLGGERVMSSHDLLMLVLLLTPGILLSVVIMVTFAAGG